MVVDKEILVFVYNDSLDRPIATTQKPKAIADTFACLEVNDITDIGAFLDWGLEKDLLVPYNQMVHHVSLGKKYVFRVLVDSISNRILATTKLRPFFNKDLSGLILNQKVSVMIYENSEHGSLAVIDEQYTGMVHKNEFKTLPEIGSKHTGYIKNVSSDLKITVSLAPAGRIGIQSSLDEILQKLDNAGGYLPYHDKSSSIEIKHVFNMSKKTFKKLIGNLKKKNFIEITKTGIKKIKHK